MKKLLSILMALAMIASLSTTAFATDTWTNDGETNSYSSDVEATYEQEVIDNYKVVVTWGALEFTYTDTPLVWDTDSLQWVEDEAFDVETGWTVDVEGGDIITIANSSSKAVEISFEVVEVKYGLEYTITYREADVTEDSFELAAATAGEGGEDGTATTAQVVVSLSGTPGADANLTNSANITVVINAVEDD